MAEHTFTSPDSLEQWKPIVGYEGFYSISTHGRIRGDYAWKRMSPPPRILNPSLRRGYPFVSLFNGKTRNKFSVHSIVAIHFIGPRPEGMQINHKNSDKTDNRAANLEYVSPKQNIRHAINSGAQFGRLGQKHARARLTDDQIREIRSLIGTMQDTQIAAIYGVKRSTIYSIKAGDSWQHLA